MSHSDEKEAEIVKFPGIASISLSITPIREFESFEMLEAVIRVYDENEEQIMRQKARSLQIIAKNLKLFIQNRTDLPINDRRMSTWFADYLTKMGIKLDEEESYQIIKKASQALERVSKVNIELVEPSDLVSIETDVLAKLIGLKSDHLMSEDELDDLLEKHQTPVTNKVVRTMTYINNGGIEHKDTLNLEIVPSEQILKHSLVASFKNETEKELTKVVISDIIPFTYKVTDVTSKEGGKYKKELLESGLKITWKVSKVAPGNEVKMIYNFEKRIPRTIYIRKNEEIRIVQDYNSIIVEKPEGEPVKRYFISEVINLLPVTLDELIIRDLIPTEMQVKEKSITEETKSIDFGQNCGINIQVSETNVETGTKHLKKYEIIPSPLIWKYSLISPVSEEDSREIAVTKLIEQTSKEDIYICTIVASTPEPCKIICQVEDGLKATEFMPSELAPNASGNTLTWEIEGKLTVSLVLEGKLSKRPQPPKVKIGTKDYEMPESSIVMERKSKIIAMPFSHVALYRKVSR